MSKNNVGEKTAISKNIILTFNFKYMIEHSDNIKKVLSIIDIQQRIRHDTIKFHMSTILEQYKKLFSAKDYLICRYKLNYQLIGSLHVFYDWFINDMPIPLEEIVSMINAMNTPKNTLYRDIPYITVHINNF